MTLKLRVEYPGAIYHVMNRGDHSEVIFRADKDRELFLATLARAHSDGGIAAPRNRWGGSGAATEG